MYCRAGPDCSKPDLANPGLARILISRFCNLSVRFSVDIFCPSVLIVISLNNLKLYKT